MHKLIIAMTMVALGCGVAFSAGETQGEGGAQGGTQSTQSEQQRTGKTEKLSGTVQSVDSATGKLSVTDKKSMAHEFTLSEATQIQKSGKTAQLSDIKEGDKVTLYYTGTMSNPTVERVRVQSKNKEQGTGGAQGGARQDMKESTAPVKGSQEKGAAGGSQGGTQGNQDGSK